MTEENKNLNYNNNSDIYNNKQTSNYGDEQLFNNDIWNNNKNDLSKEDTIQYYKKYNKLREESNIKKKLKLRKISKSNRTESKNKNKFIESRRPKNTNSDIENISDIEEKPIINKINIIDIKSNTMNNIIYKNNNFNLSNNSNNLNRKQICITEPEEYFYQRPNFFDSFPLGYNLNNTPQQMKTLDYNNLMAIQNNQRQLFQQSNRQILNNQNSYISTHNSSKMYLSKDISLEDENEKKLPLSARSNNNYIKTTIPTNESNESNKSSKYINTYQNISKGMYNFWPEDTQRRVNSSSFTESNYYNAFSLNTSNNFFVPNNFMSRNNDFNSNRNIKQLINLNDIAMGIDTRTTLMIRNIPIKYTDDMLLKELKQFENKFDCLYMPYDFENEGNKGYAFINFINPLHILLFYHKFQNKIWAKFESKKICELNFANFQGIAEIRKHAKNYKGLKKPSFFINTDNSSINIEIPIKYLPFLQKRYPKISFIENNLENTFIIKSFNE